MAMDAAGHAIAVWYDSCNYAIHATRFTPGAGWTAPVGIDQPYWYSVSPSIAMNSAGVAFVTWEAWDGARYRVFANHYAPASGWGTATLLEPATNTTGGANVAVDGAGDAVVTWYQYDATNYHVYAARYDAVSAAWGVPFLLESSANYAVYPTVAMDAEGNAFVAWVEYDGAYNIWANRYDHVSGWGGALQIESQSAWAFSAYPRVSANNGSAVVVWTMYGPGTDPYSVWANRYTAGAWGTEADVDGVSGTTEAANYPNVALDAHGNASIIYQILYLSSTPANEAQMYGLRYSALTGAASTWVPLDGARVSPGAPLIAMDSSGNDLAAWNYDDNPDPVLTRNGILSNRYTFGTGWRYYGAQQAEWDESMYPSWLQLETNAAGDAIFSWTQNDGPLYNGYASFFSPGTGWGPATLVENLDFSSITEEWSAIDGHGNALVLLRTSNGTQYNVYATYYSVGTGWGAPQRLDNAAGSNKFWLRISMNAYGDGLAVWNEYNGTNWLPVADFFNGTTHTWGVAAPVESAFTYTGTVVGGIDGHGNALAVYQAWNGSAYAIYSSYHVPGGAWGSPVRISRGTSSENVPYAVAMNERGDAAVSWNEWTGTRWDAVGDTFSAAAGWAPYAVVSAGPGDGDPAIPSIDAAGDVMLAYQLFDGSQWNVFAVTRPSGGVWGTSVRLNGGPGDATGIATAMDFRGNGYAAWSQYNGNGYDILARRYVAGTGWLPTAVVNSPAPATPSTNTGGSILGTDGHGNAVLGWNQWQNGVLVPFAAEYTVGDGRPTLAVSSPADGSVTRATSVTVSGTTDPGVALAVDGTSVAVGMDGAFSQAFSLADGMHTFTVTAINPAGLSATETRTVTVDSTAPSLSLSSPVTGLLTNHPVVHVVGSTEPGASVDVNGIRATVSTSGQFDVPIALDEGANTITATATDSAGNSATASVQVTLDTRAPALTISSPAPGTLDHANVTVTGATEPGATVTVDGRSVTVDSSGSFSASLALSEGANLITATATDAAGNMATAQVVVTYTNPAPAAQVQSSLASLNTMELLLLVLVVVSLALAAFEMLQVRKLRGRKPPQQKPEAPAPPGDDL